MRATLDDAGDKVGRPQSLRGLSRPPTVHFVNADLIAGGLSPLKPELAAIAAARMVLREIDRLASERADCAFVPKRDVLRRFRRGWENFQKTYQPMAEFWAVYDNSGALPQLLERKE